jgi:hypothetical protein
MRAIIVAAACIVPTVVGAKPPTPPAVPPQAPEPGKCVYIQPQVKQCAVSTVGGVGTFDIVIAPPAALVINFEEAITGMQPPPTSSYKAIFSGSTATVVPIRRDPIAGATIHFDTATVHVTLNLKLGPTPDTQLLIVDPRKAARDEEVERRVKEALLTLEERANERAERILLEEIAGGGAEVVDPEVSPTRQNQVVLRAKKLVRVGSRRVLVFSVDNRSGDDLEVKAIRLWAGTAGKDRELPRPAYQIAGTVHVNDELVGAVVIPLKTVAASERLRLRVELSDPQRNVELGGIGLR